jgi:hypothetical protein
MSFLQGCQIGEHQLGVDHLDIANRVDYSADVVNIATLKATHNLDDCVHLANVAQKLIPQTFTGTGAFD